MNNAPVRTVSDAKRDFYAHHTRPINSIYRRVIDELLVEMHLLSVNVDFAYDPIYALGVVTTFDRFMEGYNPESDKPSIFNALCRSVGSAPDHYRNDAETIKGAVAGLSLEDLKHQLHHPQEGAGGEGLKGTLATIAGRDRFKYSRPFGIGLYTLVEAVAPDVLTDNQAVETLFKEVSEGLSISSEKLQKDLELYRSNLEKFAQAQEVMQDILESDRKKREERQKAAQESADSEAAVTTTVPAPGEATDNSPEQPE